MIKNYAMIKNTRGKVAFMKKTTLIEKWRKREENRKQWIEHIQEKKKHLYQEKNDRKKQRDKYKVDRILLRKQYREEKERVNNSHPIFRWKNFFTRWFYFGLVLILLSIIISLLYDIFLADFDIQALSIISEIVCGVISAVGIALLVGCVFDFSKNSEGFLEFVSKILSDIIVSKTFLSSLTPNNKKEALKLILQPSYSQIEQYSNINEYFKKKIDESMKMFDTNFKTNLMLNVEARKDENGLVYCESLMTYVVYKLGDKFEPIKVSYEKSKSKTLEVKLIHENGEFIVPLDTNEEENTGGEDDAKLEIKQEYKREVQGGITQDSFIFEIPEELKHYDRLTIRRKIYEPGNNHWINYIWTSLTPYEGIRCHLKCFDGLTVKDFMIYDNKAYYQTDISEDGTTLNITSSQWLEPDTGFFVTISDTKLEEDNPNTRTTQDK